MPDTLPTLPGSPIETNAPSRSRGCRRGAPAGRGRPPLRRRHRRGGRSPRPRRSRLRPVRGSGPKPPPSRAPRCRSGVASWTAENAASQAPLLASHAPSRPRAMARQNNLHQRRRLRCVPSRRSRGPSDGNAVAKPTATAVVSGGSRCAGAAASASATMLNGAAAAAAASSPRSRGRRASRRLCYYPSPVRRREHPTK